MHKIAHPFVHVKAIYFIHTHSSVQFLSKATENGWASSFLKLNKVLEN